MRLHLERSGRGAPLVLLHGMGCDLGDVGASCGRHLDTPIRDHRPRPPRPRPFAGAGRRPTSTDATPMLAELDELVAALAAAPGARSATPSAGICRSPTPPPAPVTSSGLVVLNTGPGYRDPAKREQWNERSRRNAHRFGVPVQAATLNLQEDSVVMDRLGEMDRADPRPRRFARSTRTTPAPATTWPARCLHVSRSSSSKEASTPCTRARIAAEVACARRRVRRQAADLTQR